MTIIKMMTDYNCWLVVWQKGRSKLV